MKTLKIIVVAYQRPIRLRIMVDCFLVQTDPSWEMYVIHDGPVPEQIDDDMERRRDPRLHFCYTQQVKGKWGHPNRKYMLETIKADPDDYFLITNDDNYYTPSFVKRMRDTMRKDLCGIIYYNTLHNYWDYTVHLSKLKEGYIDMGAFIVRSDVAKAVGFNHDNISADGRYAEDCLAYCQKQGLRTVYIPNTVMFIHN